MGSAYEKNKKNNNIKVKTKIYILQKQKNNVA